MLGIIGAFRSLSFAASTTQGNLIYSGNDTRPYYRTYGASAYGTTSYALSTNAGTDVLEQGVVTQMVLKQAPSWSTWPNQKIMLTLDTQCQLTGSSLERQFLGKRPNSHGRLFRHGQGQLWAGQYRFFDVAWSSNPATGTTQAVVVCPISNTANFSQLRYFTFDPNNGWSSSNQFGYTGSGGYVRWVRMESCPVVTRSTEIAMVVNESSGIVGRIWDGTSWGATTTNEQIIAVNSGLSGYQNL